MSQNFGAVTMFRDVPSQRCTQKLQNEANGTFGNIAGRRIAKTKTDKQTQRNIPEHLPVTQPSIRHL